MDRIIVGVGDCRVAAVPGQVLSTYALGSCIALAGYDPVARVGALLHFMLPDSALDPGLAEENPYVFADTGIPLLLRQIMGSGGIQNRLILCAAGAANVVDPMRTFDIGKRNYLAMRRLLWKAGVFLHAEAVGGAASRSLHLEIGAGKLWLNEAGEQRELAAWNSRKGAPLWPTVF